MSHRRNRPFEPSVSSSPPAAPEPPPSGHFSIPELRMLLLDRLGQFLTSCDSEVQFLRLARAAQRLPLWVVNPEAAAAEDKLRSAKAEAAQHDAAIKASESRARKYEAQARIAIAREAKADPQAFNSPQLKVVPGLAAAAQPQAQAQQNADYDDLIGDGVYDEEKFETYIAECRMMLAAIDMERKVQAEMQSH